MTLNPRDSQTQEESRDSSSSMDWRNQPLEDEVRSLIADSIDSLGTRVLDADRHEQLI